MPVLAGVGRADVFAGAAFAGEGFGFALVGAADDADALGALLGESDTAGVASPVTAPAPLPGP